MMTQQHWFMDLQPALGDPSFHPSKSRLTECGTMPRVFLVCLQLSGFPLNYGAILKLFIWVHVNLHYYKERQGKTLGNVALGNFCLSLNDSFLAFWATWWYIQHIFFLQQSLLCKGSINTFCVILWAGAI